MSLKEIHVSICLLCINTVLSGQALNPTDSIEVCRVTNDFYQWYLAATNEHIDSVFQPEFAENKDGTTTLDFNGYFENLRKHHFSEALIKKERQLYRDCLKNLAKIKFTDFKNQYTGSLDQIESIRCDFGNSYRWTGGQEPMQGIRIKSVKKLSKNQVVVAINYSYINREDGEIIYWGDKKVTIVKIKNSWKIDDISVPASFGMPMEIIEDTP